ncbi:MAG: hypothetical protein JO257_16055 [Deltaproteobacteria bacterium]|nr:hypothetical protein [Deltaproteobacteria bacterium]
MGKLITVVAVMLGAVSAHAQPSDSVAAAEQLFEQAKTMMDQGDFVGACPRFEASLKLDPALGTLLNLATCYEKQGKLASAWGHYREVVALATKAGDTARIDIAKERAKALEPRLPKLTIHPPKPAISGLVVTRDDQPVESAALGVGFYVDPGEHVISASAIDHKTWSTNITISEAEVKEIELPQLPAAPHAKPAAGTVTTIIQEGDPGSSQRIFGLTLGGAGIAALVTGIGFGFAARDSYNSAFDQGLCHKDTYQCTAIGQDRIDTAHTRALVANVTGGIGLALIAGGAALYFTAPKRAHVDVAPTAGGAAVVIGGVW